MILLISGLLTAMYILSIAIRAFVYDGEAAMSDTFAGVKSTGMRMKLPFAVLTAVVLVLSFFAGPITDFLQQMAQGL